MTYRSARCFVLNKLHLEAVLFQGAAAAYMYPEYSSLLFQNQLVVDAVPVNPQQPLQGGIGIGHMQVGSLSGDVLAVGSATHGAVQFLAPETAVYQYRYTHVFTQRFQHLLAEMLEIADHTG